MKFKITLLSLLCLMKAITARNLEGFVCKDYQIPSGDPFALLRTVRICGIRVHEFGSNYFPNAADPENEGPNSNGMLRRLYTPQSYHSWNGWHSYMKVQRLTQKRQQNTLAEDLSEVKSSINGLVSNLKNYNQITKKSSDHIEETVNVNFKLDPSLEALLKEFLKLAKTITGKSSENRAMGITEYIEDIPEYVGSSEPTTENNSVENTTESQEETGTDENSSEVDRSIDDLDDWFNNHFGLTINKKGSDEEIEEVFNKSSEQEKSSEKSEENFETWFNTVYRRISTESPRNYYKSNEDTIDRDTRNKSDENLNSDVADSKSSYEQKDDDAREHNSYETIFVPTTMNKFEQDGRVDHLENSDRYDYENISFAPPKKIKLTECFRFTFSVSNFDNKEMWRVLNKCLQKITSKTRNDLKASSEANLDSNESNARNTTEIPATNSNQSIESDEAKSVEYNSNESEDYN